VNPVVLPNGSLTHLSSASKLEAQPSMQDSLLLWLLVQSQLPPVPAGVCKRGHRNRFRTMNMQTTVNLLGVPCV